MPIYKFIFEISFPHHYTGDALIDSTFHGGNTVQKRSLQAPEIHTEEASLFLPVPRHIPFLSQFLVFFPREAYR